MMIFMRINFIQINLEMLRKGNILRTNCKKKLTLRPALMKNGGLLNTCSICRFKRQKQSTLPTFIQITDILGYTKGFTKNDSLGCPLNGQHAKQ